jgi:ribulose-phosphate 3-epimerase
LHTARPAVLPSLLLCDFGHLADELRQLERAGVKGLHLDVMDGHFVPNLTYGLPIVEACRRASALPIDVHLMIDNPAEYVEPLVRAGADSLTIHIEAVPQPGPLIEKIHLLGASVGLALNPGTPLSAIVPHVAAVDMILVMSVQPGFGGQAFQPVALEKLKTLREQVSPHQFLEVDGGVNDQTIAACSAAGADLFVVGSAIFGHPDYGDRIQHLNSLAAAGKS